MPKLFLPINNLLNRSIIGLALLLLLALPLAAEPLAIVTQDSPEAAPLTREEIADLFLGKRKISLAGVNLTPVDISDEALRESFYQGIAEMSTVRVNAYWSRLVFSAQGRPPRQLPLEEAKALVLSTPGIITYIPDAHSNGFKILLRLP
ncbi:hypothetical protein JCM14076_22580 [Methylosoma difficile]